MEERGFFTENRKTLVGSKKSSRSSISILTVWGLLVAFAIGSFGISSHDGVAYASTPGTITAPADHAVSSSSPLQAFVLSGFTTPQVTITLSGTISGSSTIEVPTASRTDLTLTSGITSWEGSELSFRGSQSAVNSALANLVLRSADTGDLTIQVDAVEGGESSVNYFAENGSFYEYVPSRGITYADAKTDAAGKTFADRTGHLVTITSQSEQDFVSGRIQGATNIWIAATDSGKEGVWYWDAGPEVNKVLWRTSLSCVTPPSPELDAEVSNYTSTCDVGKSYSSSGIATPTYNFAKWCSAEPNNSDGSRGEHHAVTNWSGGSCWNDLNGLNTSSIDGYLVEYSDPGGGGSGGVASDSTVVTIGNKISTVSGASQTGEVGTSLSDPIFVEVLDGSDAPVSGVTVTFTVVSGGGSVPAGPVVTDADGRAATSWTLGTAAGSQGLRATVTGDGSLASFVSVTATATAGAASQISLSQGNNQTRTAGSTVTTKPRVLVRDQYNNPVSGISVTFDVETGGGSITSANGTTNASGLAEVGSWTLGTVAGANTLSATSLGLTGSPIIFTAQGSPGSATQLVLSSAPVLGISGAEMPTQPVVEIRDSNGNVVTSATNSVTATILSGDGGTLEGDATVSAVAGIATFTGLTFTGQLNEDYILRFAATGLSSVDSGAARVVSPPAPPRDGGGETIVSPQLVVPPSPVTPRVIPRVPATPPTQQGPVLRGNVPPAPPSAPVATIGGRSTPIQTQVTSPTGFSLRAGVLNLGLQVQEDQGVVRQNNTGGTEVEVKTGSTTALTGSGLLPRSTVQVFLPLQGTNSKEVARIPVDETGAFSGDAVFATRANERPMPIGRQVMQIVSLDENGQQSVVEMTINIAQGSPAPEFDRAVGQVPTLTPGQSVATNAGEPEIVRVTADSAVKSATVDGNGWTMSVNIEGARGEVSESGEGGALLQFVRDEGIIVTGGGFMPGTRADVWLFSDPTLLGTVDIDENGEFSGTVMVDGNVVPVGDHTLQLQGVGDDGYVRAANLGVTVSDAVAEVTTEEAAGGLLWWLVALITAIGLAAALTIWQVRRRLR